MADKLELWRMNKTTEPTYACMHADDGDDDDDDDGVGLGAEIIGTFVSVYTIFSVIDSKRSARDSYVPVLAPLPIGFAVFMVHLATILITGTGINPARSLGAAIICNEQKSLQTS